MSVAETFNGMNDTRLKPRMLRSLLRDHLPDDSRPFPSSSELASVLSHVKTHGLLSERDQSPDPNPKTMEAWRSAVDDWVDRLISLISSNMPDKCWAGICLLGVTCESCASQRFLASYSLWFQKLLPNIQPASSTCFVKVASCASLADLFTRLASFPNVKKDATSLAVKVVQPILNLLNEDGAEAVWEGAIDLLCSVISSFPFSVHRHYDNVEGVLVSKIKSAKSNSNMSRKFAYCLSLLPRVKGDEGSWSLLMQKIQITINTLLNDAFQGLEEEAKSSEIMRLLVPPGKDPPPPLGGQLMSEASEQGAKMLSEVLLPRVCTLMHCCCMMLTSPYPVQVQCIAFMNIVLYFYLTNCLAYVDNMIYEGHKFNFWFDFANKVAVPIHPLLSLVGRVLQVDGSLHDTLLPFTTVLHQELLSSELPALHLDSLDLLIAVITGVRSQLLPHAARIVRLLAEYFKRAVLPSIRTKIYSIMQILLISFGVGMVLYLSQEVINNAFADLNDCPGSGALSSSTYLPKSTSEASQKSFHRKRKHVSGLSGEQQNGVSIGSETLDKKMPAPLSVKIAALKALEVLLTVGGSLKSECWRSSVDSLLINVATNACDMGWAREGKYSNSRDEPLISRADFQLAALEALLASLLSPTHVRPPYLSQGLELFRRGKQETGTKLAAFCAHALLALEILIHPRSLPLMDVPVAKSSPFSEGFNHKHLISSSGDLRTINDLDDDDLYKTWLHNNDEPTMDHDNATKHIENNKEPPLRNPVEAAVAEKSLVDEEMMDNVACSYGGEVLETRQEATLGDMAKANSEHLKFTSGASHGSGLGTSTNLICSNDPSHEMERGKEIAVSSMDSNINRDMGSNSNSLGAPSLKDGVPNCDSDSTSMDSLPDIVDVDPDSDD